MTHKSDIVKTFSHYRGTLARYIRAIVKPQDIDDIVQETFVKSYEAELQQKIEYPKTFMLRTVRNLALNHVNKWDNKYSTSVEELDEWPVYLKSPTLEHEFESKERFLIFCRAVETLSSQCRTTFILKKVYGLSQKEVAAYLGISESTVEKHVAKGILQCFRYMEGVGAGAGENPVCGAPIADIQGKRR